MVGPLSGGRPLRVLHVIGSVAPRFGGPSKVAMEICRALARHQMSVTLFTTDIDELPAWRRLTRPRTLPVATDHSLLADGVEIRYFSTAWPSRFVFSPQMARELRRRMPDFDVVHIHSVYQFPSLAASHYARLYQKPYIIRPHGTLDPFLRRRHRFRKAAYNVLAERHDLDCASAIHYTAQDELELARPLGVKAPGVVVPLGVDGEEFKVLPPRGTFRRLHPELENKRLVVFLGRLTAKKGLDLLIRAFAVVAKTFDDARLIIAGPDDEGHGGQVRSWLKEGNVYDRTVLMGMVVGEQKLALLADTDVWVLPSYTENFGIAVVEAMACGLPIVISDRVNIHREVTAAGAGLVVPCRADELAAAIGAVLGDGALRGRLSTAAKELVNVDYSWDTVAGRLIDLYHAICEKYPHSSLSRSIW